jgi:hypothetical protein
MSKDKIKKAARADAGKDAEIARLKAALSRSEVEIRSLEAHAAGLVEKIVAHETEINRLCNMQAAVVEALVEPTEPVVPGQQP